MFVQGYTMFVQRYLWNEEKLPLVKRSGHKCCWLLPPHTCVIQSLFEIRINGSHEVERDFEGDGGSQKVEY